MSDPRPRHTLRRAFACAGMGVIELFHQGRNARLQFAAAAVAIALAAWLGCSAVEWAVLLLTIGTVLSCEGLNTAIELAVDLASPDLHPLAKRAKDMAAAAVLIAAIAACGVGAAIFLPKLRDEFAAPQEPAATIPPRRTANPVTPPEGEEPGLPAAWGSPQPTFASGMLSPKRSMRAARNAL